MSRILDWDGENVPDELRRLPPGRYILGSWTLPILETFDEVALTPDEEEDIRKALASLEAGKGLSLQQVQRKVTRALKR